MGASDLGATPIGTEFNGPSTRDIWYVRYIDWVITTPCLLLELVLATGLPLSDIIALIFFDLVMIITGLVGALVTSSYKWGYFAFGCAALVYIWFILMWPALRSAGVLGPDFRKAYITSAVYLSFIWTLYPIAKPVFTFLHLFMLSKLDYTKMQLQSGKFSEGAAVIAPGNAELDHMRKNARADATAVGVTDYPRASTATAVGRDV